MSHGPNKLRISLNINRIEGAYGGGNQFAQNLENYLISKGHQVFRSLEPELDLVLIVSSKSNPRTTSFHSESISDYILINPNTLVIHRVNTCDEQKGADLGYNRSVLEVNRLANYTIFVSAFIRDLFISKGFDPGREHCIILTGVSEKIFNPAGLSEWSPGEKIKIVTHHWSSNYLKGFDIYERLDLLLDKKPFKDIIEFTIIGNLPLGTSFKNTCLIPPLTGVHVGIKLKEHHLYLTGARHEPAGNHYIEAMRCGLPVLYLESGSSGEYCSQYGGVGYNLADFEEKLLSIPDRLAEMRNKVPECPFTDSWMAAQYEKLFIRLVTVRHASPLLKPGLKDYWRYYGGLSLKKLSSLRNAFCRLLSG